MSAHSERPIAMVFLVFNLCKLLQSGEAKVLGGCSLSPYLIHTGTSGNFHCYSAADKLSENVGPSTNRDAVTLSHHLIRG